MTKDGVDPLLQEMQEIKKLLILQLLAIGYQQKHLAAALGVSDATLSRMLPKGLPKNLSRTVV
jgi:DNA-binding transcriptional regulator LsrR (DeoR family)